ncbi:MAG: hypothetical protein RQ833_04505 [Sphingomonadaceae bacterium]|nr:hypothetical protein [Sphingomonadaceae bacterium]
MRNQGKLTGSAVLIGRAAFALALTVAPAIAAPDEVVIDGRRYSREQASAPNEDFVRRLGQLPDDGSGRDERSNRPMCVGVIGVAPGCAAMGTGGFPLISVSGHVARIALAQTRLPAVPNDAPSILSVFADSANQERERDPTARDLAYPTELYGTPQKRTRSFQLEPIEAAMMRVLVPEAGR